MLLSIQINVNVLPRTPNKELFRKVQDSARNDYENGMLAAHTVFVGDKSGTNSQCKEIPHFLATR